MIHAWYFPEKCKIITFKHSVFRNQYFNRVFAFISSTESHTRTNEKKNENFTEHDTFIDIQKITFSKKFQKQTKFFMLNEKCVLSYCKAFWHVPKHRFKFNLLNFHFDHFRFLSTKLEALVNSQWQRKFCWMKWQRKSWNGQTLQKISAKSDQPLLSPSRNKITIGFAWI